MLRSGNPSDINRQKKSLPWCREKLVSSLAERYNQRG